AFELGVASVELDPAHTFRAARITSLAVALEVDGPLALGRIAEQEPAPPATAAANELAPPPLPVAPAVRRPRFTPQPVVAHAPVEAQEPILPLPDTHAFRRRAAQVAKLLGARLPEGSTALVSGLSIELRGRGEKLAMGPGPMTLERRGDKVHFAFAGGTARP